MHVEKQTLKNCFNFKIITQLYIVVLYCKWLHDYFVCSASEDDIWFLFLFFSVMSHEIVIYNYYNYDCKVCKIV